MQSITWEAARGLFEENWKSHQNYAKVEAIWKRYANGEITAKAARSEISTLAGGITPPKWVGRRDSPDVQAWDSSYEGELSDLRRVRRVRRDRARARSGDAAGAKGKRVAKRKVLESKGGGVEGILHIPDTVVEFQSQMAALEAAKSFRAGVFE